MKRFIDAIFRAWGSDVTLVMGSERVTVRAILEPVTSVRMQAMRRLIRDAGEIPQGEYLYLGPAQTQILQADYLLRDGEIFLPRRSERFFAKGKPLYIWGLALRAGEESTWEN